jgi:hypothetical protein
MNNCYYIHVYFVFSLNIRTKICPQQFLSFLSPGLSLLLKRCSVGINENTFCRTHASPESKQVD